ncbi:hypothetical protein [Hydrocarboniphaga sp.]|uniref:hypothetical protein n=1 Tax=Hydrocarboniphaga sp. TaxID=2033016 RepID=UPI003D14291D
MTSLRKPQASSLLVLVSTPWQLFCALGLLFGPYRHARRRLVLIDQRGDRRDPWLPLLQSLNLPGLQISSLPAIGKSPLRKLLRTRVVLRQIAALVDETQPDEIIGGNDRRVEFQYAMAHANRRRYTLGAYLDDGTFSYSGLSSLRPRRYENLLRRLERWSSRMHYGSWYDKPTSLGSSRWVEYAWLAFPQHAHPQLATKPRLALDPYWYRRSEVQALCQRLIEGSQGAAITRGFDSLLILPHDHLLRADPALRAALSQRLDQALRNGQSVAVKRHPRSSDWLLDVDRSHLAELDSRLPIEAYAPWLGQAQIVGTLSTALLSLRWLCPDARIEALSQHGSLADPLLGLYQRLGIGVDAPAPKLLPPVNDPVWLLVG